MQTASTKPILGKQPAPEGIATQSTAKMQKLVQPTTSTGCLFLNKLPQELRDRVYDYVAMAETNIGLHVNLEDDSNVKSHAYPPKGLDLTCRQIRQEYSLRLERRIKHLVTELFETPKASTTNPPDKSTSDPPWRRMYLWKGPAIISRPYIAPPVPALDHSARSHFLQVAERKVSRGVYIQEDLAYTMRIPFGGINDTGLRLSTLTVTLASSAPRQYSNTYPLDPSRDESALWKSKGHYDSMYQAAKDLLLMMQRDDWNGHEAWCDLWSNYEIVFPRKKGEKGNGLQGRSDGDRWWQTFAACFTYPETTECIIEMVRP